ncbi:MAG: G5 domain-containing protein [Clostridia bacterium]
MKEDKSHLLRKTVIVITLILVFATIGLLSISMQLKTITLDYFGNVKTIKTLSTSIDSFLLENKIYVSDDMNIEPGKNSKITNGMRIKINSSKELAKINVAKIREEHKPVVAKIEEVVETIPFEEEKKDNPTINRGTTQVVQEGKEGQKKSKFIVKYNADQEVQRAQISSDVVSPTVNKVVEVGTKLDKMASRSAAVMSVGQFQAEGFKQYRIKLPVEQQQFAYNLCQKYGLDYELFLAVMYKESGFNSSAFGGGNSYGLCQIHNSNHSNLRAKLGVSDFFNPYDNMMAGAYLLSMYFGTARTRTSGDSVTVYALNAYNMGDGAYYNTCFSKGIVNRGYSNAVLGIRSRLIGNGGL